MRRAPQAPSRSAYLLVFLALWVPFTYFNHSEGWSQGARIAKLHAVTRQGTFQIDAYSHLTGDGAFIGGHHFSEKAPAAAALALPSFALVVAAQSWLGVDMDRQPWWRISAWIATAFSVGLVAAIGGVAFFALLRDRLDTTSAIAGTYALFLGSLTLPYATALFGHAATVGLLSIALWAAASSATARRDYLAGVAAGGAVAAEYPAIIACALLGLYVAAAGLPRLRRFVIGTLPAVVLILVNNYMTTGSALTVAYGNNPTFPEEMATRLLGFGWPDAKVMLGLIWGEYRGLFFWCPVLVMAVAGVGELVRRDRALGVVSIATIALVVLQVGAFTGAFGGNAIGPRYLAPALPFMGLAAAYAMQRWREAGWVLLVASMALMFMVTAIAIDPPGDVLRPMELFYLVRLREGRFAENLGTLVGLPLSISLLVPLLTVSVCAWQVLRLDQRSRVAVPASAPAPRARESDMPVAGIGAGVAEQPAAPSG